METKARVCFEFEVEKVIGISADGTYQVQWAPAWVSKFHLVGCEHLIQEFLQQQRETDGIKLEHQEHLALEPEENNSEEERRTHSEPYGMILPREHSNCSHPCPDGMEDTEMEEGTDERSSKGHVDHENGLIGPNDSIPLEQQQHELQPWEEVCEYKDEDLPSYDIGTYLGSIRTLSESQQHKLVRNLFRPGDDYKFEEQIEYNKRVKFCVGWLDEFQWLAFSPSLNGALCVPCMMFSNNPRQKLFSTNALQIWTGGKTKLIKHSNIESHLTSVSQFADFSNMRVINRQPRINR